MTVPLMGRAGLKIRAGDGCEQTGFPEMLSTPVFYHAYPGDKLSLTDKAYMFNVATYRPEIEPRWIYTYDYAPDQSWTIYNKDLSGGSYRQDDYVFDRQTFFRICLRKTGGGTFGNTENINKIIRFETPQQHTRRSFREKGPWLAGEVQRIAARVEEMRKSGDAAFIIMTDSHYTVNGTWDDTAAAVEMLSRETGFDGIIHLGDLTDGMVNADATRHYAKIVLDDLKACGMPVYIAVGNHDSNYFKNNPERIGTDGQRQIYLDGKDIRCYADYPDLRLIFIDSFDPEEKQRYGYSPQCIDWLNNVLAKTPDGSKVLIFSHLSPVTRLQYWTDCVRGESEISAVLKRYKNKIIAWINGHSHADHLGNAEGVPVITIANAKCEAFTERKPEGFITPERKLADVSQELFDVLIVSAEKSELRFIRFGAGQDRTVSGGAAKWTLY